MACFPSRMAKLSKDDQQWRKVRSEKDREQKKFNEELFQFPNLFDLKEQLPDRKHMEALLKKQQNELKEDMLQYQLEKIRCHNLIIFCLYELRRFEKAWDHCMELEVDSGFESIDTSKSIIFLTLKAVLQQKLNHIQECATTMTALQNLRMAKEYCYYEAVAESEKGYLLICIGPRRLLMAMDLFQRAIDLCCNSQSDIFLWKYDLALAIRRNFNFQFYSKHSRLSPSDLANKAITLFTEVHRSCPNETYRSRAQLELARLISECKAFCCVCDESHKQNIFRLCEEHNEDDMYKKSSETGQDDFFILRECGRWFLRKKDFSAAKYCLEKSLSKRKNPMVYQLLAKLYRNMYACNVDIPADSQIQQLQGGIEDMAVEQSSLDGQSCTGATFCTPADTVFENSSAENAMRAQLLATFDDNIYLDENGEFITTQEEGYVGNLKVSHLAKDPVQRCNSDQEREQRQLLDDFDKDTFIDTATGEFKTTQPEGVVGNLRVPPPHMHITKPPLKASHSYPPCDNSPECKPRREMTKTPRTPIRPTKIMKSKMSKLSFDANDPRIRKAEEFFLEGHAMDPTNIAIVFDIGVLYEGMQNHQEALKYYRKIIVEADKLSNHIDIVNALERSGLCLMKLSEDCSDNAKKKTLKTRAEDMFMTSLIECRKAVAHLPWVSGNRATLWESYPQLMSMLQKSECRPGQLQKEADVHEVVGKHLQAVAIYQEVLNLARTGIDQTRAVLGTLRNHVKAGNAKEAKFILDLFLTVEEERQGIVKALDEDTEDLRDLAIDVYSQAATEALVLKDMKAAQAAFRTALELKWKIQDRAHTDREDKHFELSIFYDEEGDERLEDIASCVAETCREIFDMKVSINNEEGSLGRLNFESELCMAMSAHRVMLVVSPVPKLPSRMAYIADTVLREREDRAMLVTDGQANSLSPLLQCLSPFTDVDALLALKGDQPNETAVQCLFSFLMDGTN